MIKKAEEARCVSGVSLHGGLAKPLCEVIKVKLRLPWRPQDVGDARIVVFLPRGIGVEQIKERGEFWSQQS